MSAAADSPCTVCSVIPCCCLKTIHPAIGVRETFNIELLPKLFGFFYYHIACNCRISRADIIKPQKRAVSNSCSLQDLTLTRLLLISLNNSHFSLCLRMSEIVDLPTFGPHFKLKCCLFSSCISSDCYILLYLQ